MPPRKSGASTASAPDANGDVSVVSNATTNNATTSPTQHTHTHAHPKQSRQSGGGSGKQDDGIGIDDLLLPRSLISRLARGSLPPNTSLQKDALLALTRSATVFVSYLAHHANEQSQLRHRKTLGVQDVYVALQEMEMAGVMDLGAVGKDGRQGGRLEREVALYEESVMKKRKGYREKVKARESAGGEEDRGEPDSKKIRRTSEEEEEDEDERMLEQQLNGTAAAEAEVDSRDVNGNTKSSGDDATSVAVENGLGNGKEKAIPLSHGQDEDGDVGDADDAEDDGADGADDDDDDEEEEDDRDDETEDDEDENEHENEDAEDDNHEAENEDLDDARLTNGGRRGLLPNGEVEIETDEESD
ncbi:hypothetical protein G647_05774 [Cladophialophora carrionii CBS 160.54]|uniref:DNA polymerase epsilon subunit D n=1 Tax=Cladophialophora carrionii CBS 160.54 TaxID=1279043 RepID=V9DDE0_9EURO|nr:uncharacterized protein G647_05774 [Cladophialophora carrionii CBS 160.54]ETI23967.1 hypothetical protein G647_05774 [Cladophialophora carrionii CBS 160.54]